MENQGNLYELVNKMYGEMQERFTKMDTEMEDRFTKMNTEMQERFTKMDIEMEDRFTKMNTEMQDMKKDIKETKERVINIENDHGKKLEVLFDGYQQNTAILERIEKEVARHEEIILRRVK